MPTRTLLLALLATAATASADPGRDSLYLGPTIGLLLPVGVTATLMQVNGEQSRWDADLQWQPSFQLQSYSLALAYHPFGGGFFAGGRLRYLQLHAPWTRGFDGRVDHQFALGPEVGMRRWFDRDQRFLGWVSAGVVVTPSANAILPWLVTLNLGFAFKALELPR